MRLNEYIKNLRDGITDLHTREYEEHRETRWKHDRINARLRILRTQQKDYEHQLMLLLRIRGNNHTQEEIDLLHKIAAVKEELRDLHVKQLVNPMDHENVDFNRYYKHIRYTRPFVMVLNLALWSALFWFGGVGTGIKFAIAIFALASTVGSIFELIFAIRVRERILKPIDHLKEGVFEIAGGNYDVTIEEQATSEITSLINAFNEMTQKLRDSVRLKAEYEENRKALIVNISHDLKTPITSIQGYIEAVTANADIPRDKLDQYLKVIDSNAGYMNRLIDDLFLFSKLDMQKLEFDFKETAILPFIEDMMEEFSLELQERGTDFQFENALASEHHVKLDAKRFHRIIRNLIDNAVKHGSNSQLKIRAKLYENQDFVCLDIADNGPGIPEDSIAHIFERFYRAEGSRTKDLASTGLGLAIAKELIQAHGGDITVKSHENRGSLFTVSLPIIDNRNPRQEGE